MKIAFIHDWLTGMRGGENVLEAACELFPEAEIYTLLHDPSQLSALLNSKPVHVSWLNSWPGARRHYRSFLPLMPLAIRSFDLRGQDLVLSFNHCVAKGVRIARQRDGRPAPLHICYCFTPMRYIYDQFDNYFIDTSRAWLKPGAQLIRPYLTWWDRAASRGVDRFIAISECVRRRIQKYYDRDAEVIFPPTDTDFFRLPAAAASRPYYLVVNALVPYKRVDLAIEACRRLNVPLKVVGIGTEELRLKSQARGAPVEFLGRQSGEALRELYQNCAALLFPQEEDFGIAAVEAMACGRPVIAYGQGGAAETIADGKTGLFFGAQTAEALAEAMNRARQVGFDPAAIRAHAVRFGRQNFKVRFSDYVQKALEQQARGETGRAARPAAARRRLHVMEVVECGGPGGTGYQVAAICNGLDKGRFTVSLVYSVRPGGTAREYEKSASGAGRFFHVPEMVREITLRLDFQALWRLYRIFRAYRPDIVHAHSSKAGFLARIAARAAGVPRIYYSPRGYSFLQTDRPPLSRRFYRLLERSVSKIGRIVAVSQSEAALARELCASDVRIVQDAYLGDIPEPAAGKGAAARSGLLVCAAGRMSFARNPEAFVRLARSLADADPGIRCLWIGDGELQPQVARMIRDLHLETRLEITGWLAHDEALRRLKSADILVHYSRWEGLPNVVLEALAQGLPVVASDIPGNRNLIRPGETGCLAATEAELLERTLELAARPELRKTLGERGRALVRSEYSVQRMLDEMSALYEATPAKLI
jgi:glycosyltransferase involved in cell wall biosynthesis